MIEGITITKENTLEIMQKALNAMRDYSNIPIAEPLWKGVPVSMLTDEQQEEYEQWCVAYNQLYIRHPHRGKL